MMKLIEGVDYYLENKKFVLTEKYLLKRGYCCNNNCRHCPYIKMKNIEKIIDENVSTDRCMICGWEGTSNEVIEGSKTTKSLCPVCYSSDLQDMGHNPYIDDDDITNDDDGSIFA